MPVPPMNADASLYRSKQSYPPNALTALPLAALVTPQQFGRRLRPRPRTRRPLDRIGIVTGGTEALCCGSVDPAGEVGENCAVLPPLTECHGKILACPSGELIDSDGNGSCV